MEYTLKKKTKHNINLKSNNYIDNQTHKDIFFTELLNTLQIQLQPQQFQFLTTCLLSQDNYTSKHPKHSVNNNYISRKSQTQPDQKPLNINEIDPTLFQYNSNINPITFLKKNRTTNETDHNCTNTPKPKIKQIVFQNKRLLDLDKRLSQKYQLSTRNSETSYDNKKQHMYIPHLLNLSSGKKRNYQSNEFLLLKTSFKKCSRTQKQSKVDVRRLKTTGCFNRQQGKSNRFETIDHSKERLSEFPSYEKDLSFRRSQMLQRMQSQRSNRLSENSVPKQLLNQVLFTRRQNKLNKNDFSDFKLTTRYRDCFN